MDRLLETRVTLLIRSCSTTVVEQKLAGNQRIRMHADLDAVSRSVGLWPPRENDGGRRVVVAGTIARFKCTANVTALYRVVAMLRRKIVPFPVRHRGQADRYSCHQRCRQTRRGPRLRSANARP
jgi:hypothetical protein